jgi:hypothetical protein
MNDVAACTATDIFEIPKKEYKQGIKKMLGKD